MNTEDFNGAFPSIIQFLRSCVYKFTQDDGDADDLIQETLLRVYQHRERFERGTNLQAWLYVVMRNTFITMRQLKMKKWKRSLNGFSAADRGADCNFGEVNCNVDDIFTAISKLPAHYKTPLLLRISGYKYMEIAERLTIPVGTVKMRLHKARSKLERFNYYF